VDYRVGWEFRPCREAEFKKKEWWAGERGRPDVARRRAAMEQSIKIASSLSAWSSSTNLDQDQHGAAAGVGAVRRAAHHPRFPHGRWKTTTFLAALRHDRIARRRGCLTGRSTRELSNLCRERSSCPRCAQATSHHGTISAVHKGKSRAGASIRPAAAKLFFLPNNLNPT